jgi:hypothetical protein
VRAARRTVAKGFIEPARVCKRCKQEFNRQHLYDFHMEEHTRQKPDSRRIVSVLSSAASNASSKTFVQDQFPRSPTPDVTLQPRKVADASLLAEFHEVLWIDHVEAIPEGVNGVKVLVRTLDDTVQLMPMVSFDELLKKEEQVKSIMGDHGFDMAFYMHEKGYSIPERPIWSSHSTLEDFVPEEDHRRLLESGEDCSALALHEESD